MSTRGRDRSRPLSSPAGSPDVKTAVAYNKITAFNAAAIPVYKGLNCVATAVISAAGTGYHVNDLLTISGGTVIKAALVRVLTVSTTGAVTSVELIAAGIYTANPSTPAATTASPAGGTGCTITLTFTADAMPAGTTIAEITAETSDFRFRDDGVDPTTSVGQLVKKDLLPWAYFGNVSKLRVIAIDANTVLHVTLYGTRARP